jgi:ribonuclease HI
MGHVSFVYLDDGFTSQPDRISALAASSIQQQDLKSSGLLCNDSDLHWDPMQVGEWLGLIINTISMQFKVPPKKLVKFKSLLDSAASDGSASIRQLAKIAGSVISLSFAIGPICRLCTRQMYCAIESRSGGWDQRIPLSPALLEELRFWLFNVDQLNGFAIRHPSVTQSIFLFTDASDCGFGGYSSSLTDPVVQGMFAREDSLKSFTFRELKAILYVLTVYQDKLQFSRVVLKTDSQCAARIISVGSCKPHLQCLAMDIFQLCFRQNITLETQWIPRSLNDRADILSRFIDPDDWSLHPSVFSSIVCGAFSAIGKLR